MVRLPSRGTRRVGSAPPPAPPRWTRRPLWLAPAGPPVALSARSPTPTGASGRPIHGGTGGGGGGKRKTVAAAAGGSTDARTRAAPRAGRRVATPPAAASIAHPRRAGARGACTVGERAARAPRRRAGPRGRRAATRAGGAAARHDGRASALLTRASCGGARPAARRVAASRRSGRYTCTVPVRPGGGGSDGDGR
ncbi:hypothetical protein BU14_0441s0011 [Porphyra umbilicalis]|uniref:Uncharacterized protein n=1 Tax=Porphyra umbilicalis TaxID=2786 RepID=A0A1X6NUZ1_PORUM|nr:hypothetical protein BU14_0441s0011 [Porphyra umbilicalis]|eukprot:OSX72402.1 hypothetical protein BU14_0441s0011 [Porphyra umbilicalis]